MQILLDAGADCGGQPCGKTPLMAAVQLGYEKVVAVMIQMKVPLEEMDRKGLTPLMLAAAHGRATIADMLIEAGALVNKKNQFGSTALWYAAQNGHLSIVRSLLKAGADPNTQDTIGQTPLHIASGQGFKAIVRALIEARADLHLQTRVGATPLYFAARGQVQVAQKITETLVKVTDEVLSCKEREQNSTIKALLQAGASPDDIDKPEDKEKVQRMQQKTACGMCSKPARQICGSCHSVHYCSRECQRSHWAVHKLACKKAS